MQTTLRNRLVPSLLVGLLLTGCLFDEAPRGESQQGLVQCGDQSGPILASGVPIGTFAVDYVGDDLVVSIDADGGRVVAKYYLYAGTGPVPANSSGYTWPEWFPYVDTTLQPWQPSVTITVPLSELGVVAGECPTLTVALYTKLLTIDSNGNILRGDYGWADGPISFPHGQYMTGYALESACCVAGEEPPTPAGDTSIEDQLGPLYTGEDPPQEGVAPGAIDIERIAAVRGLVTVRDGGVLPGVRVSIAGRPDYGFTFTDENGEYTMVVSGGERVLVNFELDDHLPAQRDVTVGWEEIAWTDDVALVDASASPATVVTMGAANFQQVVGATETDGDGTRRAVILFPPGTTATLEAADGTQTPLTNPTVSVTEYTVGDDGPKAMPGQLPRETAYTYAAAFQVQEAGVGETVHFGQPVIVYVENFLGFPVGEELPSGSYDEDTGAWVAEPNGRVLEVTAIDSGVAALDIDGDGLADDEAALAALGITTAERIEIGGLYAASTMLWRVPVSHFSTFDFNPALLPPTDAKHPRNFPYVFGLTDAPCEQDGSVIECEDQILRETVPIAGTSFGLHYTSAGAEGRSDNRTLVVPLTGSESLGSCTDVHLEIFIAGRRIKEQFNCAPNQTYTFAWDGLDAWGERVQGSRLVRVRVGYQYNAVFYARSEQFGVSAIINGQWPLFGASIQSIRAGQAFILWTEARERIGGFVNDPSNSIGGWTLTAEHRRDRLGRRLYFGDGTRQTVGGGKLSVSSYIDGPVTNRRVEGGLVPVADGSVFYSFDRQIFRRDRDGQTAVYAGNNAAGQSCTGDVSDPLTAAFGLADPFGATIRGIQDMALGPDQSLYVLAAGRLTRIDPDGQVRLIASETGICGAVPAGVVTIGGGREGISVAASGTIYLRRGTGVERLEPDGTLTDLGWQCEPTGIDRWLDIEVNNDGSLVGACINRIKRRDPDGTVVRIAGRGTGGEGAVATEAAIDPDGRADHRRGWFRVFH